MKKAVFLDRDGVIIKQVEYLNDPAEVELIPGTVEALRIIHERGSLAVVVSNQSGIARGRFTLPELDAVQAKVNELLAAAGEKLDGFYYCPHDPHVEKCLCRKPNPGMLQMATEELDIDLENSIMIGDRPTDLQAGFAAGCRQCYMVKTGYGAGSLEEAKILGFNIADNLLDAVQKWDKTGDSRG